MSTLSTLAASLSHDINNPLSYVSANLLYAIEELREIACDEKAGPTGECEERLIRVVRALAQAEDGARRITRIVRRLEAVGDVRTECSEPVDIRELLASLLSLIGCELGGRATVSVQLGEVPPVAGPRAWIARVLLELMVNALPAGGGADPVEEPYEIRLRTWTGADGSAVVEVAGSCARSPGGHLGRALQPGPETGALLRDRPGLFEARAVVDELGGSLEVEAATSRGAAFQLRLPPPLQRPRREARPGSSTRSASSAGWR